jgi:hypothetical protein
MSFRRPFAASSTMRGHVSSASPSRPRQHGEVRHFFRALHRAVRSREDRPLPRRRRPDSNISASGFGIAAIINTYEPGTGAAPYDLTDFSRHRNTSDDAWHTKGTRKRAIELFRLNYRSVVADRGLAYWRKLSFTTLFANRSTVLFANGGNAL